MEFLIASTRWSSLKDHEINDGSTLTLSAVVNGMKYEIDMIGTEVSQMKIEEEFKKLICEFPLGEKLKLSRHDGA